MEPLNDDELNRLLAQWKAPNAPPSLDRKVLPRPSWWRWMLSGTIRVPVPVGVAALVALGVWLYFSGAAARPVSRPEAVPVTLADFQPVKQLEPRIVRTTK